MNAHEYTLKEFTETTQKYITERTVTTEEATVLALHGDLGSGKTTFTQIIACVLGVTEPVVSPTFLIQKTYQLSTPSTQLDKWNTLVHIDAYRLVSAEQLKVLGWDELVGNPKNIICIEWPENVSEALPESTQHIYFTFINETIRRITW